MISFGEIPGIRIVRSKILWILIYFRGQRTTGGVVSFHYRNDEKIVITETIKTKISPACMDEIPVFPFRMIGFLVVRALVIPRSRKVKNRRVFSLFFS